MLAVPLRSLHNISKMNEKIKGIVYLPPLRSEDNGWIRDGEHIYEIENISEQDHEGSSWLDAEGRTADRKLAGEWISYDDGETWRDIDDNGWW